MLLPAWYKNFATCLSRQKSRQFECRDAWLEQPLMVERGACSTPTFRCVADVWMQRRLERNSLAMLMDLTANGSPVHSKLAGGYVKPHESDRIEFPTLAFDW